MSGWLWCGPAAAKSERWRGKREVRDLILGLLLLAGVVDEKRDLEAVVGGDGVEEEGHDAGADWGQ